MSVNFAQHAEPAKLWCHNDIIYAHHLTSVPTTSHCPKRDATMVSGRQATLHTYVLIRTATKCDDSLSFWLIFRKWYDCHFIEMGYKSPLMKDLENRDSKSGDTSMLYCYQPELQKVLLRALMYPWCQGTLLHRFESSDFGNINVNIYILYQATVTLDN